ncbi:MAG: GIY-YIG nuclease family protein [Candidatus Acidiferrales bacterium]
MAFFTYILRSKSTGRFYVGHTENLQKRVFEHNNDRTVSIKNRGPWELAYSEEFTTRLDAIQRERQIKNMKSHAWIERLVRASR